MEKNKKLIDLGILSEDEASGVKRVSIVEEPAIELDFRYFGKQYSFVKPSAGETQDEFIGRCIPVLRGEGKPEDQAIAICYSYWEEGFGLEKFESYNDYPESAKNAAKRALEWRDNHPDQECGTAVGWTRANQLAKGENISEETIARMASFARHLQYKDVPYSEGCGGLMVDAWGGQAGIEWASNKLKELRGEDFDIDTAGLTPYVDPAVKKKDGKAEAPITKAIAMEDECPMDYSWTKDAYAVETVLRLAAELGTKEEDLKALFEKEFAFANPSAGGSGTSVSEVMNQGDKKLYLYKYTGPISDNSRDFCVGMIGLDLFYTKAQIQAMNSLVMNPGFGHEGAEYSIWQFKGGPNCKHRFVQYLVTMPEGQIQIEEVKNAAGRAGRTPYSMPKHGYYKKAAFKFSADDKMVLVGPAMVPDINIPRVDDDGDTYFVRFSAETIREIAMKYMKEARTNDVNTDHEENNAGAYIYESWLVESPEDKANTVYGYDVPVGTWMVAMKVDDKETWTRIKAGNLRGFSIEGILMDMEELEAKKKYERIKQILS